jgi:hypothetical protein
MFDKRTKHIEVDFDFVLDQVMNSFLQVKFISSKNQLVDLLPDCWVHEGLIF